jgi:hypothetical protein
VSVVGGRARAGARRPVAVAESAARDAKATSSPSSSSSPSSAAAAAAAAALRLPRGRIACAACGLCPSAVNQSSCSVPRSLLSLLLLLLLLLCRMPLSVFSWSLPMSDAGAVAASAVPRDNWCARRRTAGLRRLLRPMSRAGRLVAPSAGRSIGSSATNYPIIHNSRRQATRQRDSQTDGRMDGRPAAYWVTYSPDRRASRGARPTIDTEDIRAARPRPGCSQTIRQLPVSYATRIARRRPCVRAKPVWSLFTHDRWKRSGRGRGE